MGGAGGVREGLRPGGGRQASEWGWGRAGGGGGERSRETMPPLPSPSHRHLHTQTHTYPASSESLFRPLGPFGVPRPPPHSPWGLQTAWGTHSY